MSVLIETDIVSSKPNISLKKLYLKRFKLQEALKQTYAIQSQYWNRQTDNQLTLIKFDRKIIGNFGLLHKIFINLSKYTIQVQSFVTKEQYLFALNSKKLINFVGKQIVKWQSRLLHTKIMLESQKGLIKLRSFCFRFKTNLYSEILQTAAKMAQASKMKNIQNIKKVLIISNQISRKQSDQCQNLFFLKEAKRYLYILTLNPFFQYSQSVTNFSSMQKHYQEEQDKIVQIKKNIKNQVYIWMDATLLYDKQFELLKEVKLSERIAFQYSQRSLLRSQIAMPPLIYQQTKGQNNYITNYISIQAIDLCEQPFDIRRYASIHIGVVKFHYASSNDAIQSTPFKQKNKKIFKVKRLIFKIPNDLFNAQQKLNHQKQIILKMRGGYNSFLPKFYLTLKDKFSNSILADFIEGPSLRDYLDFNGQASLWTKIYLIFCVVQGLRFVRSYQITHLDIKPTNIMISKKMTGNIIDFGQSFHPQVCSEGFKPGYTLPYSPPQIFSRIKFTQYSQKQDVYSLGVIIFELIFSRHPFQAKYQKLIKQYFKNSFQKCIFTCPQDLQSFGEYRVLIILYYLTMRCMSQKPENRPYLDWIALIIKQCINYYRDS